ncbi:pyridoxal-dependent decarboxylase [Polyangium mundeleinium]|uniref:Pyridoxal-dependent decarboxylase n=1 Tax=Polyangium mundeleinium TaxID=2995306 RepID=A0ABT5EVE3_9BACT|nr:pyridoxal-dependent decarboxylase [Polyangium mundeleinium]MDC0744731.1 pyridoxal-dependent decarboxylase [Polyangium mundeleinium]
MFDRASGLDDELFRLRAEGLSPAERAAALDALFRYESRQTDLLLGYQCNERIDCAETLSRYLDRHLNNVGDPFQSGSASFNTKWLERAVLDYFAALWRAKTPHDPDDGASYWGYLLTMGSTEGNLYGLWNARDYLAGKFLLIDPESADEARAAASNGGARVVPPRLVYQQAPAPESQPNARVPIAFYSQDTHYSIIKAMRVLDIRTFYEVGTERYPRDNPLAPGKPWPHEVPSVGGTNGVGVIDIDALTTLVAFFASRGHPILVNFNYGTTFKGAYDDVEAAGAALLPILRRYGLDEREVHYDPRDCRKYDVRTGYWFHVDGALGAAYMPFLEMAHAAGRITTRGPNFDFRLPYVCSLVMSGHKWIGAPFPCGVYMTRTKLMLRPPSRPEYIGSPDTTFAGSRNGLSALVLWDHLARRSYEDQIRKALYTEDLSAYAERRLRELGQRLGQALWVERAPLSLTIRFRAVSPALAFKYTLACETLYVDGEKRQYHHIYVMEHVTRERIDAFLNDLAAPDAFPAQEVRPTAPAHESHVAGREGRLMHVPHTGRSFSG